MASQISTAEAIDWSKEILALIDKVNISREEVEEVFLNLPAVKRITLSFPDQHQRFCVEGTTDRGKKVRIVCYILKKKIQLTYIKYI